MLRGAERTLSQALLVESEVEFQSLYVGQPLFRDIDAFMAEEGLGAARPAPRLLAPDHRAFRRRRHAGARRRALPEPGPARVDHRGECRAQSGGARRLPTGRLRPVLANRIGRPELVERPGPPRIVDASASSARCCRSSARTGRGGLARRLPPRQRHRLARRRLLLTTACAAARADRRRAAKSPSARPRSTVARGRARSRAPRAPGRRRQATRCGRTIGARK